MVAYTVRSTNGTASQDSVETIQTVRFATHTNSALWVAPTSRFDDARLASGRASVTVPFTLSDGRIEIAVSIDGYPPMPFLVDSGAGNLVTPDAARALGLSGAADLAFQGTGGGLQGGQLTTARTVSFNGVEISNQSFIVTALPRYLEERGDAPPIAGLVGAELLRRFPVTIDYVHRTLTLYRPGSRPPRAADARPIALSFSGGHPFLTVKVDGKRGVFGMDTGDNSGLTMFGAFYRAHRFAVEQPGVPKRQSGVGGDTQEMLTRVASLELAGMRLTRPLVNINLATRGGFSGEEIAGNLGYGFLRNFVITLDYEHRVGFFAASSVFNNQVDYNRSGLVLGVTAEGGWRVDQVTPGTPAARAGLLVDDRIVSINGVKAGRAVPDGFSSVLSEPVGSVVAFVVSRGGAAHCFHVRLEELLLRDTPGGVA